MENIDIQEFKKLIKKVKFFYNIKQVDIAHTIDVTGPYLSDMINGRVPITDQVVKKIYEFYSDIKDSEEKKVQILEKKKDPFQDLRIDDKLNLIFELISSQNKKIDLLTNENNQLKDQIKDQNEDIKERIKDNLFVLQSEISAIMDEFNVQLDDDLQKDIDKIIQQN